MAVVQAGKEKEGKLIIKPLDSDLPEVAVLFNPNSYTITKPVTWTGSADRGLNAPTLVFGGGGSRTLTLELFFDVTEPVDGNVITDVRDKTNAIVALTRIERKNTVPAPPVCEVSWGNAPPNLDFPFIGVITNLVQAFKLFRSTGEPVRATLTVTMLEFLDAVKDKKETDPELTTRRVRRGDTLTSIAAEVYRDATEWRAIAQANNLDDPRRPRIGQTLSIPKLR
jgi:contractile injection system tube protein/LysM domain-containing protein